MATLSIESLQQQGAFTGAPVRKDITWTIDGESHKATVYVRRLSYLAAMQDMRASQGQVDGIAGRIASCTCDENGQAIFTPEDITGEADPERGALHRNLTLALLGAIGEVNAPGKTPSRSAMKRKSGTSSSSTGSAGAQSPKHKRG